MAAGAARTSDGILARLIMSVLGVADGLDAGWGVTVEDEEGELLSIRVVWVDGLDKIAGV